MPVKLCPHCGAPTARLLTGVSTEAIVNYYRCLACGHVWTVPKDDPDAPTRDVTIKDAR
jgi:uncharacterized Zn finger protein